MAWILVWKCQNKHEGNSMKSFVEHGEKCKSGGTFSWHLDSVSKKKDVIVVTTGGSEPKTWKTESTDAMSAWRSK